MDLSFAVVAVVAIVAVAALAGRRRVVSRRA